LNRVMWGDTVLNKYGSRQIAAIAIKMALTETREEETELKSIYAKQNIKAAAVDCGGDFINKVKKFTERSISSSFFNVTRPPSPCHNGDRSVNCPGNFADFPDQHLEFIGCK
jgi:hypothetical protein